MDEGRERRVVRKLGVAVEQQRRVVRVGQPARVQLLEVRGEVRQSLRVEELYAPRVSVMPNVS